MNRILYLSILTLIYLQSGAQALAADTKTTKFEIVQPSGAGIMVGNRTGSSILSSLVTNLISALFVIAAIAIVVMVLWGALEWIISGGNKDKLSSAQKRITTALIGAAVLALSFVILRVVGEILNFNILGPYTIPKLI